MRTLHHLSCALLVLATAACTRAIASEKGDFPVGVATLEVGTVNAKVVPSPAPTNDVAKTGACEAGMVLIEGEYCPDVQHKCVEWLDPPESRYAHFRCKKYEQPAKCNGARVHKRYCIDATERTEEGSRLPRHFMSWTSSKALCEGDGARLCRESEWVFACEGEEMRPYPYGWERDSSACNVDLFHGIGKPGALKDHRTPAGSFAKCASPFGVQDMAGNVEEWVQADGPGVGSKMGWKEVLKGSWWIPSRHACRQFQVGHDAVYNGAETGARCCKDARAP